MLRSTHRGGGARSRAPRRAASTILSAVIVPSLLAASQAAAEDDPTRKFGETVLTDNDDSVTNSKTVDLIGDVNFGDGSDGLVNTGVITIGAKTTSGVQVSLVSLEALKNGGLIDLRNGHGGDVLTISGNYNGASGARLGLDVLPGSADRLVVGKVANGATQVVLGGLSSKTATLTGATGPVLIEAGAESTADAFRIENEEIGLIRYSLVFNPENHTYRLRGQAGRRVFDALKISQGAGDVWRQSANAWSAHLNSLRDLGSHTAGAGVWGQAFGGEQDRDDDVAASDGTKVATDYRQATYGGQFGVDLVGADLGEGGLVLGLTGGYARAKMRFATADMDVRLNVANLGGYLALSRGGYFFNLLAKADRQSVETRGDLGALPGKFDGATYGGKIEAGHRFQGDGMAYEQLLSIDYVSGRLDDLVSGDQRLDFDRAVGFVGKLGVRGSAESEAFEGALTTYGAAFVAHDFTVKNALAFASGGQVERLTRDGGRTFGQIVAGATVRTGESTITFLEASGEYGGGRRGGGLRVGARIGF